MSSPTDSVKIGTSLTSVAPVLAKNPLGVIALALLLVYAMATAVLLWGQSLDGTLKAVLVWFLVIYAFLVLGVFVWLIAKHSARLYAPSDFRDDESFLVAAEGRVRSAVYLSAAQVRSDTGGPVDVEKELQVAGVVNAVVNSDRIVTRTHLLWVDDRPENNVWEREAFLAAGLEIKLALNTTQALELLLIHRFALVISDMGRVEGDREGYVLLDAMRKKGDKTPLVFYAASGREEHRRETREHGGQGCTNDPTELFELAMALISRP